MAYVAGIDWSMSCPAICIYNTKDKLEFKNCEYFFYHDNKKYDKSFGYIHGFKQKDYECQEERYNNLSEWAIAILLKFSVKHVTMEGYAMGASKGLVFNIAENGGLLKHKMWMAGIEVQCPAPSAVKKHFTTKGNANKELMYDTLVAQEGISVVDLLVDITNAKPKDSPIADIVDAYAMIKYMISSTDSKYIKGSK